jgi:hypothetical protein
VNESRRRETMTVGCASLPLDEKFMRRRNENHCALKTRLESAAAKFISDCDTARRDHYYCVQEQLENLCTGTPSHNVAGINLCGRAAPVSSISAAPTFAAAAQNFNSHGPRRAGLKYSYVCECGVAQQSLCQDDDLATHNEKCAKSGANFVAKWL